MGWAAGNRVGPYEIQAPLGSCAVGEAYTARDTRQARAVRIEISSDNFTKEFERQALAIAALHHPHICALLEAGPNYLAFEWAEGVPLKGPLSQQETLRFAAEICDALEYAHQRGVIHGALSPSNILVTQSGVKLADFGLARIAGAPFANGTAQCAAPEQRAGRAADARSDVYAMGCVLYEMLMGRPVAEGRRPVRPEGLERVLRTCLAGDPQQRWQSAGELKMALGEASKPRGYSREYLIAAGSVVMLIAGMVLLVMQFPSHQKLSDKDVLVLGDFGNSTGDAIFDGTLRTALAIQLEQSLFLKMLDEDRVQRDLKLMGRAPETRITNVIAHDICVRERQKAMLNGAIADLGKTFVITVQAVNCQNGATLAREQVQAQGREQVLNAVSKAAIGLRAKLGESPSSRQSLRRPLEQATNTSIEAFQAYARGSAQQRAGNIPASIAFFQRARVLDPDFALAHLGLARAWAMAGDTDKAKKAYQDFFALWKSVGADLPLLEQAKKESAALNSEAR